MKKHFLGVDVGTSSIRVALFDSNGKLIDLKAKTIAIFNHNVDFYEQSSEEIWLAICQTIKLILAENPSIKPDEIVSIGFDATCSLVVLDSDFKPVTISLSGNDNLNVVMWMDHRSAKQTEFINSTNHECLKTVGGSISLEMDPPKLLWIKENLYEQSYKRAAHFFSLPDYLVWKCSNCDLRSICTTNCKWLYKSEPNVNEWDTSFWNKIGLSDLTKNNFEKIGTNVARPFSFLENLKVSPDTAKLTGLSLEVKVGISMIDAHAGGIGGLAVTMAYLEKENSLRENFIVNDQKNLCNLTFLKLIN